VGKRGPNKKPGFRQELRVTNLVEKMFITLRDQYELKNNSEALHKMAEILSLQEKDIESETESI
jgi:hypothetical protein